MSRRAPSDGGLRPMLRQHLPMVHWTTVESGALAPGTPDCEGCWAGVSFWVECKATAAWAVRVRPEQVGWHLRRARAGGRSYLLTRRQTASGADELWLHRGSEAALVSGGGLRAADPLLVSEGGPAGWDWEELLRLLVGPAAGTLTERRAPRPPARPGG